MKNLLTIILAAISLSLIAQNPTFVAHRGASFLAPENTVASTKLAWELGVQAAECDIMLTKDRQVIVFHDKKGKRLTGKDFIVKEINYKEIKVLPIILKESNLPKYAGETIPLLADLLATIPEGRTLVIEIKTGPEILPYMKEVISEHWKSGNISFIAFDFETILATKKLYPNIPCYYLSAFKADINKKLDVIAESNLNGINLRHKIIDQKLVDKCQEANIDIWCWTINEPEDAERVKALGVSAITTDRPVWLAEQMK
jgi:glycerophosphoryl diester phosphodiesterase